MSLTNDDGSLDLLNNEVHCYFCDEKFNDFTTLRNHIEVKHLLSSITDESTTTTKSHKSIDDNVKIVKSSENIESFNNKKVTKKRHKNSEKDISVLIDKSKDNDESRYFAVDDYNKSIDTILENICKICNKILKNKKRVYWHMKTVHSNITISCPDCNKPFSNKCYLRRHCLTVHSDKIVFCYQCKKYFSNDRYLNIHNRYFHSTASATCDHCNKIFKHITYLRSHERLEHSSTSRQPCPNCQKTPKQLSRHMKSCTLLKSKCHICNKKIKHVQIHFKKRHSEIYYTGEMEYRKVKIENL